MKRFLFLILLSACSTVSHWRVDSIAAGDSSFNSSRLRYAGSEKHPTLLFEMFKLDTQIEAFLSLTQFRLSPDCSKVTLTIRGENFEEAITPHEGLMRVRLPSAVTNRLIQALQDGEKVSILIDGFEETLEPDQFSSSFAKFTEGGSFFQNILKGPLQ